MARTLKEEDYTARRNDIIDAALRLVYSKGYEKMTIQDILDDLKISKGAFYHYFGSKDAMLGALVARIQDEVIQLLLPIIQDTDLSALEKLEGYFLTTTRWKTIHKSLILALIRAWYADDNAIVRQASYASASKVIAPLLSEIFSQGVREGVFTLSNPDRVGEVFLCLIQGIGEELGNQFLSFEPGQNDAQIKGTIAIYTEAMERVLGAPTGSIHLIFTKSLENWFKENLI